MKHLWNAIVFASIANLVAIAGFVGWLTMADRLDTERAREIRLMLSQTITQERELEEKDAAQTEQLRLQGEAEARARRAPLTAAERLAARIEATEFDRQRMERLRREIEDLQRALARERADLDARQARLTADEKSFQDQIVMMAGASKDEQFQKTLGVLESLKPAAAKSMLQGIMGMRDGAGVAPDGAQAAPVLSANQPADLGTQTTSAGMDGMPQAVEFLNAMDDKARSKVMAEFVKDDPDMATRLLLALRQRGQFAPAGAEATP